MHICAGLPGAEDILLSVSLGDGRNPSPLGEEKIREVAEGHEHDERAEYDIPRLKTV